MRIMDYRNVKSILLQKKFQERLKSGGLSENLKLVSLKDVPLKVRRREAKKPLFLTRYE